MDSNDQLAGCSTLGPQDRLHPNKLMDMMVAIMARLDDLHRSLLPSPTSDDILDLQNKITSIEASIEHERTQLESFRCFSWSRSDIPPGWEEMERFHSQSLAAKERLLPHLTNSLREMAIQLNIPVAQLMNEQFTQSRDGGQSLRPSSTPLVRAADQRAAPNQADNNCDHDTPRPPANSKIPSQPMNMMLAILTHAHQPVAVLRHIFRGNEQIVQYIEHNRELLLQRRQGHGGPAHARQAGDVQAGAGSPAGPGNNNLSNLKEATYSQPGLRTSPTQADRNTLSTLIAHAHQPVAVLRRIFRRNEQIVQYVEAHRSELLRLRLEDRRLRRTQQQEQKQNVQVVTGNG